MAITQAMCTSFKAELLVGAHNFRASTGNTFKVALYASSATLDANTTAYTTSGEITGTNYVAGGQALTNAGVTSGSAVGFADFDDETFANVTLTARGALIYNSNTAVNGIDGNPLTNPAVAVLDFGGDKVANAGDFQIIFPTAAASTAIIRIA